MLYYGRRYLVYSVSDWATQVAQHRNIPPTWRATSRPTNIDGLPTDLHYFGWHRAQSRADAIKAGKLAEAERKSKKG